MPIPWTPKPFPVLKQWIDTICDEASDDLTDWESNFIESVNRQLNKRGSLSEKQEEILERIYAEKTK